MGHDGYNTSVHEFKLFAKRYDGFDSKEEGITDNKSFDYAAYEAVGIGQGRKAEFDEGRAHIWATGMGLWGVADGNKGSLDNDFTVGMFGAEFNVAETTKLGAFFGVGSTKISGDQGSIKSDDKHYGS